MKGTPTLIRFVALLLGISTGLAAQDNPAKSDTAPRFDLLGNVTQKATSTGAEGGSSSLAWAFTSDLKPKFTYGALTIQADTTWTLPLSASLTAASPVVAVSEAYFRVAATPSLDLTFGQKRFSIGVGQTFTVGDSINPVIGFFDQKTGFRGVTVEWSPVSWASLSAGVSTEKGTAESPVTGATQVSLLLEQLQLTASLTGRKDATLNPALGASYDLWGTILTVEGAAEFLPQGKRPTLSSPSLWSSPTAWSVPALSGSAGARWTPSIGDWDLVLSAEYLHWGQGWTADETDAWKSSATSAVVPVKAAAGLVRSTMAIRSQENAFLRVSISTGGTFSLTGFAAVDLQDRSILGQATVLWNPWDNVDLSATLQAAGGDANSAWEYLNPNKDRYQASFLTTYHF